MKRLCKYKPLSFHNYSYASETPRACFICVSFVFSGSRVPTSIGSVGIQIRSMGIAVDFLPSIPFHPLQRPGSEDVIL